MNENVQHSCYKVGVKKPAVLSLVPLYLNNQFDLLTNLVFFFFMNV